MTLEKQAIFVGRVRRALRAFRTGRMNGETYDRLMLRIQQKVARS